MSRTLAKLIWVFGLLAVVGCGGEPVPGQPGGTVEYNTPETKKAQAEAPKLTPEQMMEQMKSKKDPTKK